MPEVADSLNQFMEQVASVGALDSEGAFTLDVDRAGDKVKRFQLVDPYLYAVHLVSAAVLGTALNLRLSKTATQIAFSFDGDIFTQGQLEALSQALLTGFGGERRLQELAIAVSGARSTGPHSLVFESVSSNGTGVKLQYQGEKRSVAPLSEAVPGNRLILEYPVSWRRLAGHFDTRSPEVDVLRKFCSRAPLSIKSDLVSISAPEFSPADSLAWKYYRGQEFDPGIPMPRHTSGYCASVSWRQPYSAVLCLTNPAISEAHGLTIVLNGVSFRRKNLPACPYACGVVFVRHLNKNISHTDLAEDQAYQELIGTLSAKVDELWREFADHNPPLSRDYGDRVSKYLTNRYPTEDRPLSVRRYLLRQELEKELESTQKGAEFLDEANELEKQGDQEQAVLLRTKVFDSVGRLLVRDYPNNFDSNSARLSELSARALRDLNGSPSAQAQEVHKIVSCLAGQKAVNIHSSDSPSAESWALFRSALMSLVEGKIDKARSTIGWMGAGFSWRCYLEGQLNGDPDSFVKAATLEQSSAFLWNEASAACRLAGRLEDAVKYRTLAVERLPSNEPYFIRRLVKEVSGKAGFGVWVSWVVRSRFRPAEEPRVAEFALSLDQNRFGPGYAKEGLRQFAITSFEYAFLEHLIRWSWRQHESVPVEAVWNFLGRSLLLRMLEPRANGLVLTRFRG